MSHDSKKKDNVRKIPLIEDNANEQFNQLQKRYLEFLKDFEEISEYENKLNKLKRKEYDSIKDNIYYKIHKMPETINTIDNLIDNLTSAGFKDLSLKSKVDEQVKIINEKLRPKQIELSNLLNRIVDREGKLAKRLSVSNIEEIIMTNNDNTDTERSDNKFKRGSFRESKLVIQELVDNSEYLRKRQEELEDIKKISSQVRDITTVMVSEVNKQAVGLKSVEDDVIQSNLNVKKAEFEIEDAEKVTRRSSRKLWCLVILILILAISTMIIGYMIFNK